MKHLAGWHQAALRQAVNGSSRTNWLLMIAARLLLHMQALLQYTVTSITQARQPEQQQQQQSSLADQQQQLYVSDGFDGEQVWLQLDMQLAPLRKRLKRLVGQLADEGAAGENTSWLAARSDNRQEPFSMVTAAVVLCRCASLSADSSLSSQDTSADSGRVTANSIGLLLGCARCCMAVHHVA